MALIIMAIHQRLPRLVLLLTALATAVLFFDVDVARLSKLSIVNVPEKSSSKTDHDEVAVRTNTRSQASCSCLNTNAPKKCCVRTIHRTHKFGWALAETLFGPANGVQIRRSEPKYFPSKENDYRNVLLTRNVYDAIVSGYLYHKSGQECSDKPENIFCREQFVRLLSLVHTPPVDNHTLCSYLASTTESEGIKLYTDVALGLYRKVDLFWHEAQRRAIQDHVNKTLFVCMEELSRPEKQLETYEQIMDFYYPRGNNFTVPAQLFERERYGGIHATSHDPAMRSRLRALVEEHDRAIFNQKVSHLQSLLKCEYIQ